MEQPSPISDTRSPEYELINDVEEGARETIDKSVDEAEEHHEDSEEEEKQLRTTSTKLFQQRSVPWIFALYAALVIASWTSTCLLTFRPLPQGSYVNVYNQNHGDYDDAFGSKYNLRGLYNTSRAWYRAAQTVQAIVALLTLTITATICSKCAVVFLQQIHHRTTLRQALKLSDKGWLDPQTYLSLLKPDQRRSISSPALYVFIAVTITGAVIPPLEQVLVTQSTIKVPVESFSNFERTADIDDLLGTYHLEFQPMSIDNSRLTILAQESFVSSLLSQPLLNLWIDSNTTMNCNSPSGGRFRGSLQVLPSFIQDGEALGSCQTYGNRATTNPPFITQLPAFQNTGLIKQFVPRMNSTLNYVQIDASEFPDDCTYESAGYYTEHKFNSSSASYSVKACILETDAQPPWKPIRDRQDARERFFLQVYACTDLGSNIEPCRSITIQTEANTTLGWFELPNYANGNQPGPLLEKSPFPCHSAACAVQLPSGLKPRSFGSFEYSKDDPINGFVELSSRLNIGPLTLTVLALFGLESWLSFQTSLATSGFHWPLKAPEHPYEKELCSGAAPLANLNLMSDEIQGEYDDLSCLSAFDGEGENRGLMIATWLEQFFSTKRMQAGLSAAMILASNVWLWNEIGAVSDDAFLLMVTSDPGMDTIKPSMSLASMIVISTLWVTYLAFLFMLVCYSRSTKVWTGSLDAFTVLRIGATLSDKIDSRMYPLTDEEVQELDELPGWFGDGNPSGDIGEVELGAEEPLRSKRRYTSYAERPSQLDE